jgi:hypothetical protein
MRSEFNSMADQLGIGRTIVHARITNGIPANYGVVIVECGVVFAYEVAGTQAVGPFPMYLTSGQSYDFYSQPIEDCCDEVFFAMSVLQLASGQKQTVVFNDKAPEGQCIIDSPGELIIRSRSAKADKRTLAGDFLNNVEIARR